MSTHNIEPDLSSALGPEWRILCRDECDSTMTLAKEAIPLLCDKQKYILALAQKQAAGRGRQGRKWESPEGNFYGTFVFRTAAAQETLSGFSLVAGIAICRALGDVGQKVRLKWPNDLVTETGRKLGGILVEVRSNEGERYVLAGIGINIADHSLPENSAALDTLSNHIYSPAEIAALLAPELARCFEDFLVKGFEGFREEWMSRCPHMGSIFEVESGGEVIKGVFRGVRADGAMILEAGDEVRPVITGHIVGIHAAND